MKELVREGVRLCYQEAGAGDPALVFIHGWCCDHSYFSPQFEHFAARHRVVALDQRGFGQSDKPEQDYTIEAFASDVAWLCQELALGPAVLVGHSMGGAIALATAAQHPDVVHAAVLVDPAVVFPAAGREALRGFGDALGDPGYLELARGFITDRLFIEADDPQRRARITEHMLETPQRIMHSAMRNTLAFDGDKAAKECATPVLLIDA